MLGEPAFGAHNDQRDFVPRGVRHWLGSVTYRLRTGGIALQRATRQIGFLAGTTLVLLRLVVGFHFLNEGLDKLLEPRPFSAAFFSRAVGPAAEFFRGLAWDPDGLVRLGYEPSGSAFPNINMDATKKVWEDFRARVVAHFQLDDKQAEQSQKIVQKYQQLLDDFARSRREELIEYFQGVERRNRYWADRQRMDVASLRGQVDTLVAELDKQRRELLAEVEALWSGLERELNALGEQSGRGPVAIPRLARRWLDSETLDKVVPWFDVAVGISLITGLLVRPMGLLASLFLASIVASQWPLDPYAASTWPQAIELAAVVHLTAMGAGRWAGADAILAGCCAGCCRRKPQGR
ncbi:MAG: hypothetical protein KatS3mg110_4078 [Pirellulaceae bacterium]|nr:MAG: hypothetical protein KatS3mg110_4078 [Pirellulaceae bacterium]